jgi:hypothetical protein
MKKYKIIISLDINIILKIVHIIKIIKNFININFTIIKIIIIIIIIIINNIIIIIIIYFFMIYFLFILFSYFILIRFIIFASPLFYHYYLNLLNFYHFNLELNLLFPSITK